MADRKLWRVTAIIHDTVMHDLMMLIEGKCIGHPEMVPVRHGGSDENGKLQPPPSSRDFALNYAAEKGGVLVLKDAAAVGEKLGISKSALTQALYKLTNEKIMKRGEKGIYHINEARLKRVPQKQLTQHRMNTNPVPGERMSDRIVAFLRERQNGNGEGIKLDDIKEHLAGFGYARTGVGSELHKLVNKEKIVVRVGYSRYRTAEPQHAAH